ncbi:T9SS type A sorting domain-containing protein [Winogradskyella alexanderae]|uniref:T9SS type A sorting domain-containing protein n=1 Tax=Winogradskyella alexanderae TaxID=2877123 RepID=A0ABS7XU42_9FLAO|nr:T9SS type A sorting domain-containing protein [Winogradskyella alexanderae]MCA0133305.1 T9SS type A sorting domain-containing protein [Winogradskyella alexanderae]
MKKITLLFTLLFSTSIIFSQVVLTEDFEGGLSLPAGWANTDTPGNGEIWTFETGGEAPFFGAGNTVFYDPAGMAGNYAIFNSDAYGNNGTAEESALESPIFDCGSLTNVTLRFNHLFLSGFGGEGYVEVFDGTTWQTVIDYMEPPIASGTPEFGLVELDVSAELAGVTNAQVRFRWVGNWSYYWAFDNVEVFQCTVSAPAPVVSPMPMDAATNVALDQTDATNFPNRVFFSWVDGPGDPGNSYTLNLGVQNPPTDNTFTGFPNGDFIFNLAYDTTYFWSVESINCAGSSTSAVWSFTTEQDPALSIDEVDLNVVSVSPNPTKDILNIRTNLDLDSVQVYNLLGQSVAQFSGNSLANKSINLSNLEDGLYMVEVIAGNKRQTFKVNKN